MVRLAANTFAVSSYSPIETASLSQGTYVYSAVKNATPKNIEELKKTKSFAISVATLMKGYAHFLVSPQIKDISTTENPSAGTITYNIVFNTMNGVFLAILEFQNSTQTATIRALVLIDGNDLKKVLRGCQDQNNAGDKCSVCEEGFYLNENGFCYDKIKLCRAYIGNVCVSCDRPYTVDWQNNACVSDCGELCKV